MSIGRRILDVVASKVVVVCLLLTCDDPGVEVESHLPAVLQYDRLQQVTVPLHLDLLAVRPGTGVHQPCSNGECNVTHVM